MNYRDWSLWSWIFWIVLWALIGALLGHLLCGCQSPPDQGQAASGSKVEVDSEGPVDVDAPTITDMEAMAEGAVKADTARDIRTFGIDEGTLAVFTAQLGKATKVAMLVIGIVGCVAIGFGILFLFTDAPDGSVAIKWFNVSYKALALVVALALLAVGALSGVVAALLASLAGL